MAHIFMDESGDLGFDLEGTHASRYFVVTFLCVPGSKRPVEKIVSKIHSELTKRTGKAAGALHSTSEKHITRRRLLRELASKDVSLMCLCLNKTRMSAGLRVDKQLLYGHMAGVLLDRVFSKGILRTSDNIELIASRRETSRYLNAAFIHHLNGNMCDARKARIKISIKTPFEEKALQAVDFASGAIFRKYEKGDESYYEIIKKKIDEEGIFAPIKGKTPYAI